MPSGDSVRAAHVTGASANRLLVDVLTVPRPSVRVPSHRARAVLVTAIGPPPAFDDWIGSTLDPNQSNGQTGPGQRHSPVVSDPDARLGRNPDGPGPRGLHWQHLPLADGRGLPERPLRAPSEP